MKKVNLAVWAEQIIRKPVAHLGDGTLIRHSALLAMTKVYVPSVVRITDPGHGTAYVAFANYGPVQKWDTQIHVHYSGPSVERACAAMDAIIAEKTKPNRPSGSYQETFPARFRDLSALVATMRSLDDWWRASGAGVDPELMARAWMSCAEDLYLKPPGGDPPQRGDASWRARSHPEPPALQSMTVADIPAEVPSDAWEVLSCISTVNFDAVTRLQAQYIREQLGKIPATVDECQEPEVRRRFGL